MPSQTIDRTNGVVAYTQWTTILCTSGQDISGLQVQLALGDDDTPGTFFPPDQTAQGWCYQRDVARLFPGERIEFDPVLVGPDTKLTYLRSKLLVGPGATVDPVQSTSPYRLWRKIEPGLENLIEPTGLTLLVI